MSARIVGFLSLCICFLLKAEGKDLSVTFEPDTVEIGQLIRVNPESKVPGIRSVRTPGWELVSASAEELLFQIFEPGSYRMPILESEAGEDIQLVSESGPLVVRLPKSVEGDAALRTILGPMTIRQGWLVRWRSVLAGTGAVSFAVVLLLAAIRSAGPEKKLPPPPSALHQIRADFETVRKLSDPDQAFSETQVLFRRLLAMAGVSAAASGPIEELAVNTSDILPHTTVEEMLVILQRADEQRFNGGAVSSSQVDSLQSAFSTLLRPDVEIRLPKDPSFERQFGSAPGAFPRIMAGLLDLIPLSLLFLGLSGFPELHALLPWELSGDATLILASVLLALVCKSLIEWLGTTSAWQASPGMRCLRLAVVTNRRLLFIRAGISLLASLPAFLGHVGMFTRSGLSLVDRYSFSLIRQYLPASHE